MSDIRIAELWTYPIKSCAGVQLERAVASETGFEFDREFMLVDAMEFVTQRREPALARVAVGIESDHLSIGIAGVGTAEIATAYNPDLPLFETEVHHKPVVGRDQGGDAQEIFSRLFGREVKVLRASREQPRSVQEPYQRADATNRVAFGDGFPYLLTSRKSLAEQHRVNDLPDGTVPMDRFRPNIVVDGPSLVPYEEDSWVQINTGSFGAFIVRACDRCLVPTIVQTGEQAGEQGEIAVKARFLKSRAGIDLANPNRPSGRFFGQNLNPAIDSNGQVMNVGDRVSVLSRGAPNIELRAA